MTAHVYFWDYFYRINKSQRVGLTKKTFNLLLQSNTLITNKSFCNNKFGCTIDRYLFAADIVTLPVTGNYIAYFGQVKLLRPNLMFFVFSNIHQYVPRLALYKHKLWTIFGGFGNNDVGRTSLINICTGPTGKVPISESESLTYDFAINLHQ